MNVQKLARLSFTMITMALVIATVYSTSYDWGVYIAVREFQLGIKELDIEIVDTKQAQVEIILTLKNPSVYVFTIRHIQKHLYLEGEYFLASESSYNLQIAPQSSSELPVGAVVPEGKIHLLSEPDQKEWLIYVSILVQGPLIGSFEVSNSTYLFT